MGAFLLAFVEQMRYPRDMKEHSLPNDQSTAALWALAMDKEHPPERRFASLASLLGFTQEEAAAAAGLHMDTIRNVLRGGSAAISTLEAIEKTFGIPEGELRELGSHARRSEDSFAGHPVRRRVDRSAEINEQTNGGPNDVQIPDSQR